MPSNEGWDSVFLQALQNSLAQSKAETKWNQELAFRDKEFEQKKTEFDWTKAYNEKQLEMARQTNLADFNSKFRQLQGQDLADWNSKFAGMFGAGGDNPYTTDVVESNYIPWAAYTAKEDTRRHELGRSDRFFELYSDNEPKYNYDTAKQIAQVGSRQGSTFDSGTANLFGIRIPDANKKYYLNTAVTGAGDVEGSLLKTDRDNAAATSRIMLQIANDNANRDKDTRGYYKVFVPGKGTVDAPNMTLSEIEKVYGKNAIIEKVPDNVGFSSSVWNLERGGLEKGLNTIKDTDGAIAFIEALRNKGVDVNSLPEVRSKLLNIVENEGLRAYEASPKKNIWGQIDDATFRILPKGTGDLSYREAINQGLGSESYYRAKSLLGGMQPTGMNTRTTLNQGY